MRAVRYGLSFMRGAFKVEYLQYSGGYVFFSITGQLPI